MEEQVQHIFKNKASGAEHLLPISFKKLKEADQWEDLGEGYLHKDPVSGINYAKLKNDKAAKANEKAAAEAEHPEVQEGETHADKKAKKK